MNRAKYVILQILYWSSSSVLFGYTVGFLQAHGFSNSEAGIIVSLCNFIGLLGTVCLGTQIDHGRLGLFPATVCALTVQIVTLTVLAVLGGHNMVTAVCCIFCLAFSIVVNPLYIKLSVDLNRERETVSFGLARGAGSLSFAVTAWAMGFLAQEKSVFVVPVAALCVILPQLLLLFTMTRAGGQTGGEPQGQGEGISIAAFLRKSPRFCLLLIGIALLFAAHNTVNSFLINIVKNVGGSYNTLGRLTFFLALVEFPAMLLYSRLGRQRCDKCLRISFLFFPVKLLAITQAGSVPALFFAFFFQSLSFGLYTPAIVDYVGLAVSYEDSAKGQGLAAAMASVGTMIAALISGFLLDHLAVQAVLALLTVVAVIGAAVSLLGTRRLP